MGHPTWAYRRGADGEIESEIFDSDEVPEGWVDSPADVGDPPKRRGRPPKVKDETEDE